MKIKHTIIVVVFFYSTSVLSQDLSFLDSIKAPELIDSLFIDREINNWSFRLFTNFKEQRFRLSNKDQSIIYFPNNPSGIGFGLATRKLLLDIAFNIKNKNEEPTNRFDLQATMIIEKHLVDYFLQVYQGFNVKNDYNDQEDFRKDLTSTSSGINYMYLFNTGEYSIAAIKSGLSRQKKTAMSFGLGGFLFIDELSADSSIIPEELHAQFNKEAQIENLFGVGIGVLGGFVTNFSLPGNFFAYISLTPGIGLMFKNVETESLVYKPSNPFLYQLDMAGALGYNGDQFYVSFITGLDLYNTDLDFGNKALLGITNAKLVLGYKLTKK